MKSDREKAGLEVVLIGSREDKAKFFSFFSSQIALDDMIHHRDGEMNYLALQFMFKVREIAFVVWALIDNNLESVNQKLVGADAFIYLNLSAEQKKSYEKWRNKDLCVAYAYQSENFKDALNCLESIAAPQGSHDPYFDIKLSSFLCAHAFDIYSLPVFCLLPREVNNQICQYYASVCNQTISLFQPKIQEISEEMLTCKKKTIRKRKNTPEMNREKEIKALINFTTRHDHQTLRRG